MNVKNPNDGGTQGNRNFENLLIHLIHVIALNHESHDINTSCV
jgi:hypothetical protein